MIPHRATGGLLRIRSWGSGVLVRPVLALVVGVGLPQSVQDILPAGFGVGGSAV